MGVWNLKNIDVGDEIKMIMNVNRMHAKRIMVFWLGVIFFITLCPMLPFRAKDYLFSSFPMGTESYYVYVSPNNQEITAAEYHSLDGK